MNVGIAPGADLGVEPQVFVTNIMTTDPGLMTVDDDALAMVTEVELEAIPSSLGRVELRVTHTRSFELIQVGVGEVHAADLVVEKEYVQAPLRAVNHGCLETPPETIVVYDVKLHEGVTLSQCESIDYAVECRLTVHEELDLVSSHERRV